MLAVLFHLVLFCAETEQLPIRNSHHLSWFRRPIWWSVPAGTAATWFWMLPADWMIIRSLKYLTVLKTIAHLPLISQQIQQNFLQRPWTEEWDHRNAYQWLDKTALAVSLHRFIYMGRWYARFRFLRQAPDLIIEIRSRMPLMNKPRCGVIAPVNIRQQLYTHRNILHGCRNRWSKLGSHHG